MSDKNDVSVKFGADLSDLESAAPRAASATEGVASAMTKGTAAASGFGAALGVLAAEGLARVGEAIKDSMTFLATYASEMENVAAKMGISTQEASGLAQALEEIGVSTATYERAAMLLAQRAKTNEEGLRAMGLEVRDSSGHLKNQTVLIQDAVKSMLEYKAGTDRSQASLAYFGMRMQDGVGLLRLTSEGLKDAQKDADDLGLSIGQTDVDAFHEFQKAQANVGDGFAAMKLIISRDVLPAMTSLMNVITDATKAVLPYFRLAWAEVVSSFEDGSTLMWAAGSRLMVMFQNISNLAVGVGQAAKLALAGGFTEAGQAMNSALEGNRRNLALWQSDYDRMLAKDAAARAERRSSALSGPSAGAPYVPGGAGSKDFVGDKAGAKGRSSTMDETFAAWQEELQVMKITADEFRGVEASTERDFWESKLALAEGNWPRYLKTYTEFANARRKAAQEELTEALKTLDYQKELAGSNKDEIVQIEQAKSALIKATRGESDKQYIDSMRQLEKAERDAAQARIKIEIDRVSFMKELSLIDIEDRRKGIEFMSSLGAISGKEQIQELRTIAEDEFRIKQEALLRDVDIDTMSLEQQRKYYEQLTILRKQHDTQEKEFDRQLVQENFKTWSNIADTVTGAFSNSIRGVIQGTQTLSQAFKKMGQSIILSFIDLGIQMVATWIKSKIAMLLVEESSNAAKETADATAAATGVLLNATANVVKIGSLSALAGAGTFAQVMASVPFPYSLGVAPVAAAEAVAATLAFAPAAAAAEGGWWDVPSAQSAMLHPREMVLPADIATSLRGLVGSGGQPAAGGAVNVHISAIDAAGVKKLFMREGAALVGSLKNQMRNFNYGTS